MIAFDKLRANGNRTLSDRAALFPFVVSLSNHLSQLLNELFMVSTAARAALPGS